jgi:tetratricopeptide (TPR) repeat protein
MSTPSADAGELVRAAWAAYARDQPHVAESLARDALAVDGANGDALGALGYFLHATRRFAEAIEIFRSLADLQPRDSAHRMNLGTALRCASRFDEALKAYAGAAALGARSADFFYNVGLTHIDRRDYESGRAVLSDALSLAPNDAEICYHYASCCYERLRTAEALAALEHWGDLVGLTPDLTADIGLLLMKLGDAERAEAAIRRAVIDAAGDTTPRAPTSTTAPGAPSAHPLLTLVQLLERTNRLEEAGVRLAQLSAHPAASRLDAEITLITAQLAQRSGNHEAACSGFRKLLQECREFELRHLLEFPLAKSLDALRRYDEAFETLCAAHRSQEALLKMTAPILSARGAPSMIITRFSCDPEDVAGWSDPEAPPLEDSPVFIVAFPRSGTTLLELTLDAHPRLVSMDEQPFVQAALDDLIAEGAAYPERMAALAPAQLAAVRSRYWERARTKVAVSPGRRLVDKNPLNILRLPVIRRLFPQAPIILAVRHPCDVLLSCFMQHFRTPDFALLCADLETLALGYRRTFDFWYRQAALLDPRLLEIRYETLTVDFAAEIRRVLEFLKLPWDDAVLRPEENAREKRFISTPSYSQVIEPVNRKAVDRWRAYERHFIPILPMVAPYLERWGYNAPPGATPAGLVSGAAGLGSSNIK